MFKWEVKRVADPENRRSNDRLRYERKLRGWTLDDVAERLHRLAEAIGSPELGVDAHMVGRWERGVRRPAPRYVALLCRAFELPADELGLVDGIEPSELKEENVRRRQFLQYLGVVGGATMLDWERLGALVRGEGRAADQYVLDDLEALTRSYARQVETMAPASLLPAMRNHLNVLTGALHATSPAAARTRLLALTAETALLTGRASWLLENRGDARACWSFAQQLAREAGDESLLASTLAMQRMLHSTIPSRGRFGDTNRALAILDEAEAQLGPTSSPYVRIFVLASRAEDHAAVGNAAAAYRDLDRAETALESAAFRDDGYFVQWDRARIAGYRGSCELALHRPGAAVSVLESALAETSSSLLGQRCAVVTDLAAAYAQQREVEQSCALLVESMETAERTGLSELIQRVFGARQQLGPWQHTQPVRRLDERLLAVV